METATVESGCDGAMVCIVEDVGNDEVDKIVGKVVGWDCCAEGIRVALFFGSDGAGLLVDFVGDPLRAEELPRLAAALGKKVRLIRDDAAIRPVWRQVWENEPD